MPWRRAGWSFRKGRDRLRLDGAVGVEERSGEPGRRIERVAVDVDERRPRVQRRRLAWREVGVQPNAAVAAAERAHAAL